MEKAAMKKEGAGDVIIHQLNIRQINRSSQDISTWRKAIMSAESVYSHNRTLLYDLYHDILLDGHLSSVIDKRITATVNTPITFGDDGNENDAILNLIETEDFVFMIAEILHSKFWGHTLLELPFAPNKFEAWLINRKHVIPEKGHIKTDQNLIEGFPYRVPPYSFYTLEAGRNDDLGLLMKAAQYVIYKRGGFGDWAQFAELFGMPFRKGVYDGYDTKTRDQLIQAMDQMGSAPYIAIPREADIEIVPNNSTGSNLTYSGLIEACNKEISKLIVGQTMTSEDGSSLSQSQTHMTVQNEIHFADRLFVTRVLNHRLIPLLAKHGYPVGNGKFSFVVDENLPKDKMIEIDLKVASQVPVGDDYWYETYGVPKPDDYETLKEEKRVQTEIMQRMLSNPSPEPVEGEQPGTIKNAFKRFFS